MKIVLSPLARRQLASQIQYLVDQHAHRPAARLKRRVISYLNTHVAHFPKTGRAIPYRNTYETWIPRTPYVVIYRLDDRARTITVLALFHTAQDRTHFDPSSD